MWCLERNCWLLVAGRCLLWFIVRCLRLVACCWLMLFVARCLLVVGFDCCCSFCRSLVVGGWSLFVGCWLFCFVALLWFVVCCLFSVFVDVRLLVVVCVGRCCCPSVGVCCSLFVVRCSPCVVCRLLFRYMLFAERCSYFVGCWCLLFVRCCLRFVVCCLLLVDVVRCWLSIFGC